MRWTLAVAVAGALALPGAALADCGGVQRVAPTRSLGDFRAPLIVGDSVLLGAVHQVAALGFEVNAHGCRGWQEGRRLLWAKRHAGQLPHLVAVQLGTDFTVSVAQVEDVLRILGRRRVLVLVTPREAGGFGGADASAMRQTAGRHPNRIVLLDWARHTAGRDEWFAPDGIHLTYAGRRGLVTFLRPVLARAAPPAG
jgi:hypothetical protein